MPTFAEIEPLSLSDRVINALKDAFFAGELKPGDAIVERELARQMKVGTPCRSRGVDLSPGAGFRSASDQHRHIRDSIYDRRSAPPLYPAGRTGTVGIPVGEATGDGKRSQRAQPPDCESRGSRGERRSPPIPGARLCLSQAMLGAFRKPLPGRDSRPFDGAPLYLRCARQRCSPHGSMGREHYELIHALQNIAEPEFTEVVRKRLTGFASRWLAAFSNADGSAKPA